MPEENFLNQKKEQVKLTDGEILYYSFKLFTPSCMGPASWNELHIEYKYRWERIAAHFKKEAQVKIETTAFPQAASNLPALTAGFNKLASKISAWARRKGWEEDFNFTTKIALCHSELSEAIEIYRNLSAKEHISIISLNEPHNTSEPLKPVGIPIELADCIIRILHICGYYGIDIEKAIELKMDYNETRPYRHGNKSC